MGFFSGFSGEFGTQLATSRREEADRAERQSALESSVLQSLASSPDPEIASHAITGLLDLAGPQKRGKGLAGWLGQVGGHPALPTIRQLIQQGRTVEDQPPHVPSLQVEGGLRAGAPVGVATPGPAVPAGRAVMGPPSPDEPEPTPRAAATTPPPSLPAFAQGDVPRPATSKTVPRRVIRQPGELEAEQAGQKETAVLAARGKAYDQFKGTPGKETIIPGVTNPPAPRAGGEYQDPETQQWYKQDITIGPGGERTITRTPITKPTPRASAPAAQAMERSLEILATMPGLTPEQALEMARAEGRQVTLDKVQATADTHLVRQGQVKAMIPQTIAAWQRVNGTVPMTRAQATAEAYRALSAARQTLGGGPDITSADITGFADALLSASLGRTGAVVSPTRAALGQPLAVDQPQGGATAPPPGAPAAPAQPPAGGALSTALPPSLANTQVHPKQLTAGQQQDRTTAQQLKLQAEEALRLGEASKWKGVGGMYAGSVSQFRDSTFGDLATPKGQGAIAAETALRNTINKIFATVGQLQGGQTFTANELQIIKGYAPTINQSIPVLKANLAELIKYVDQKLALAEGNVERGGKGPGAGTPPPPPGAPPPVTATDAVPPEVSAILKGQPAKRYTLTDGSVWIVDASGQIRKGS